MSEYKHKIKVNIEKKNDQKQTENQKIDNQTKEPNTELVDDDTSDDMDIDSTVLSSDNEIVEVEDTKLPDEKEEKDEIEEEVDETDEIIEEKEEKIIEEKDVEKKVIKKTSEVDDDEEKEDDVNEYDDDCFNQYDDVISKDDINQKPVEITGDKRITEPNLYYYEKIRILGARSKQIAMGSKVMLKMDNINKLSYENLAKYELEHKMTPIKIKRPLPNNTFEIWKISELKTVDDNINDKVVNDVTDIFKKNKYILF